MDELWDRLDKLVARESVKLTLGVVGYVAAAVVGYGVRLWQEWWRKIHYSVSGWEFQHNPVMRRRDWRRARDAHPNEEIEEIDYYIYRINFTIKIFNKKSNPVGLHLFSVHFTKGPWYWRREVYLIDTMEREEMGGSKRTILETLTLTPDKWVVETIRASFREESDVRTADAAWLVAQSAEGKRLCWLIARRGKDEWPVD